MQETPARPDDEQIDLLAVARKLWAERKLIVRWCAMAALAGLVIGFSIPKEYTTETVLAPETSSGKGSLGGLSSLASLAGINMGNMTDADAINPDVYPEIVESLPFVTELFPVVVETRTASCGPTSTTICSTTSVRRGGARCFRLRSRRWAGWLSGCAAMRKRRVRWTRSG